MIDANTAGYLNDLFAPDSESTGGEVGGISTDAGTGDLSSWGQAAKSALAAAGLGDAAQFLDPIIKSIDENIQLVQKYGWSSWGASTSPEKMKAQFAENVYPWIESELATVSRDTFGAILTGMHTRLSVQLAFATKLRKYHANAGSTQLALDWAKTELQKLLFQLEKLATNLRANGVTVNIVTFQAPADDYKFIDIFDNSGEINNGDVIGVGGKGTPIALKRFEVDASTMPEKVEAERNPETGEMEVKSSNGLLWAGLAFAAFKFLR